MLPQLAGEREREREREGGKAKEIGTKAVGMWKKRQGGEGSEPRTLCHLSLTAAYFRVGSLRRATESTKMPRNYASPYPSPSSAHFPAVFPFPAYSACTLSNYRGN